MDTNSAAQIAPPVLSSQSVPDPVGVPSKDYSSIAKFIGVAILILFPVYLWFSQSDAITRDMTIILGPICFVVAILVALSPNGKEKISSEGLTKRNTNKMVYVGAALSLAGIINVPGILFSLLMSLLHIPNSESVTFGLFVVGVATTALGIVISLTSLYHKKTDQPAKSVLKAIGITILVAVAFGLAGLVLFVALI